MENKEDFIEDPRFQVCFKEMIICYIFYFFFFALVMLATYNLGNQFVLGLPLWFLVAGIVLPIIFILIIYILVEKVFQDTDLDPYID